MKRTTRTLFVVATGLLTLVTVTACGSSSNGSPASSTSLTAPATSSASRSSDTTMSSMIMIKGFAFAVPDSVQPGATVMVMNEDSEAHTVTSDRSGLFDVKVDPGKTVTLTAPSKAGSYAFHCSYHSQMHGTLKVG